MINVLGNGTLSYKSTTILVIQRAILIYYSKLFHPKKKLFTIL